MRLSISSKEIRRALNLPPPDFPTYVSPLLNLANRFARGTVPAVVGQMTDLIQEFEGRTLEEWATWYQHRYPEAIEQATRLIRAKLQQLGTALNNTTDEMIREWVKDLVLAKTFVGLRSQEAILTKVARQLRLEYRPSAPHEEAQGIDGYMGAVPVSVKPLSYREQLVLRDALPHVIIYYTKEEDGTLSIEFDERSLVS